tara:strand:- start:5979 stop:6557 length:579 start_codon:yes stop_codon:yes gene_type:complete
MINTKKLDWKKVWINNGSKNSSDLKVLNGHDKTSINSEYVVQNITELFDIISDTKVLEVGCGAGMLAQHFKCSYVGVDYSHTLIDKHKKILGNEVYVCEANELIFEDCEFDFCFSYSIFQYFPNYDYMKQTISEMIRVSKRGVFIGDIPLDSHEENHLLFNKNDFDGWITTDSFYKHETSNRFNAYKKYEME